MTTSKLRMSFSIMADDDLSWLTIEQISNWTGSFQPAKLLIIVVWFGLDAQYSHMNSLPRRPLHGSCAPQPHWRTTAKVGHQRVDASWTCQSCWLISADMLANTRVRLRSKPFDICSIYFHLLCSMCFYMAWYIALHNLYEQGTTIEGTDSLGC